MIFSQGSTQGSIYFRLRNATTGLPETGLVFNSPGASASYTRPRDAATVFSLATLANPFAAWSEGGFVEVGAAAAPGLYRLDIPDAALATGSNHVWVSLNFTATIAETKEVLLNPEPNQLIGQVVADVGNSATQIRTNLPVKADNDYQDGWVVFRDGILALSGPRQVTSSVGASSTLVFTNGFTSTPADNAEFLYINR